MVFNFSRSKAVASFKASSESHAHLDEATSLEFATVRRLKLTKSKNGPSKHMTNISSAYRNLQEMRHVQHDAESLFLWLH
jgi:hypothetical protein